MKYLKLIVNYLFDKRSGFSREPRPDLTANKLPSNLMPVPISNSSELPSGGLQLPVKVGRCPADSNHYPKNGLMVGNYLRWGLVSTEKPYPTRKGMGFRFSLIMNVCTIVALGILFMEGCVCLAQYYPDLVVSTLSAIALISAGWIIGYAIGYFSATDDFED